MLTKNARTRSLFIKHSSADGSFYTSDAPKAVLVQKLRNMEPGHNKQADIGGEQESGFEQAFSSLAYSYIRDKSPRLLDYVVGFQLVDRNEDNTKAVAVFGFKVGKQWLYAPVFFLNGDLKGHELLYIKNQDAFVPMKENWVNYIMGRKPHVLGEGSSKDVFQLGGLSPNIERMAYPPANSKFGSDLGTRVDPWAMDALPVLAAGMTKSARFLWQTCQPGTQLDMTKVAESPFKAAMATAPTLDTFLKEDWRLAKLAFDWTQQYPGIKIGFDKFYGADFFVKLAEYHKVKSDQNVINIMPGAVKTAAARVTLPGITIMPPMTKKAVGDAKVKIIVKEDVGITKNLPELTEKDKTEVLNHGYLVKDERTGEEVTKVYNTQVRQTLTNPMETGLYEVLERPGTFSRMLIITHPISNTGGGDFVTAIRLDDGDKEWINCHRNRIYTKSIELDEDYRKWFKGLPDGKSLTKGGTYVAISERGEGTVPFKVGLKYGDGDTTSYKVDFKDSRDYDAGRPGWMPKTQYSDGAPKDISAGEPYYRSYGAILRFNARQDTKLRAIGGELYVPTDSFKFFKIKDPPKPKTEKGLLDRIPGEDSCGECGSEPKAIDPGDIKDIQMLFTEKTASLKMLGDGSEVNIYSPVGHRRSGYKQALFDLIRVHGCCEGDATEMLKVAAEKGNTHQVVNFRVKYAEPYPLPGAGPTAPPFPAPTYGSEQNGYNSVNAIYPQEDHIPIPGLDSSRTDPNVYNPWLRITPDTSAMNFAQQAGQEGQKEVFDTSVISGMLKSVRQDNLVDKYLGSLMKALDNLGRLLFMFYWHGDDFAERYSKGEMPEMEDSLRNTFEATGDLVLFLKEKEIEPSMDNMGDPSIEESARN